MLELGFEQMYRKRQMEWTLSAVLKDSKRNELEPRPALSVSAAAAPHPVSYC